MPTQSDHSHQEPSSYKDPMRVRFALVVALLTMAIIGLTALNAYQIRAAAQERSAVTTRNLITLVERQVSDTLSKVDLALQTAAIEIDRELTRGGKQAETEISEFLKRQHALLPEVIGYRAADAQGNVRFGEDLPAGGSINIADRDYFKSLRESSESSALVFGPIYTHISKQWSIGIARAIRDANGHFQGVVAAAIPVKEFQKS